jgi:hypothetical protein
VKSFALELEEGNPASRRWVETRFLTKQAGEWYGYSYAWNEEQTEATLVGAAGVDRDFTVRVLPRSPSVGARSPDRAPTDGVRKQTWHYPSRSECMACHSRAANYVLGLTELQMNKEHDYGKVCDNQLRTLEHLGVMRINWADDVRTALRDEAKAKGMKDREADTYVNELTATRLQRGPVETSLLAFSPEKYRRLADPYDTKESLEVRARSYLHANCAQCHVEAGGGNAQIDLEYTTDLAKARIIDVKPVHHTFGLPDARLVAPGSPERSVLLSRLSHREAGHMPPLGTNVVDREAVKMLHDWIKQLPPAGKKVGRKELP